MKRTTKCLSLSQIRFYSDKVHGFNKIREARIPELALKVTEFEHCETGGLFYHLDHRSAAAFSIAFRTLPDDSTGLPHILEHTALCGSKTFPVRDPFFKMLNRSLAVYMNAWTGADFTQYPFVTENASDYDNLRKVYLDAVFNPTLSYDDFLQEGWRLELSGDKKTKLAGVVYNEMKGALSDADSYFMTRFQQVRFGDKSVYGVVSGGDPVDIPKLSHSDLVAFHRKFYHPSNSVTVSSGDAIALEDNLKALNEYFSNYERKGVDLKRLEMKANTFGRVEATGPVDPLGDPTSQIRLLISYLANETKADEHEAFALKIMCELLFEGPAAPFYKALIDSGLGSEYAPGTGYDTSTHQSTISVGLQGLPEEKLQLVEETIDETFRKVRGNVSEFIGADRVETVLHQVELGLRYPSANFGLSLVSAVTQSWIHGVDPVASLSISQKVTEFKRKYKTGGLFEGLLDKFILNNTNTRMSFVMRPDPEHASKLSRSEEVYVTELEAKMSENDFKKIAEDCERLKLKQESEQDLSCLPCLKIEQVPIEVRDPSLLPLPTTVLNEKISLFERSCEEANGLVYFKALLKLDQFREREILLMPLLLQCLSELGGKERNSAAGFDMEIKRFTGGIGFSLAQGPVKYPTFDADLNLLISSYALEGNYEKMVDLMEEALFHCNVFGDKDRIKMLIAASAMSLSNAIASSGNRFAALKAASSFPSTRAQISECLGGLAQAHFMNSLVELSNSQVGLDQIIQELFELKENMLAQARDFKKVLIHSGNLKVDDHARDDILFTNLMKSKQQTTSSLSSSFSFSNSADSEGNNNNNNAVFIPGPFSSNFSALTLIPFSDRHPSAGEIASINLLTRLLRTKHLHREIREKGGAYGSAASYSALSGLFNFSSYRDPTPFRSLAVFKAASEALLTRDLPSEMDLVGAKLSIFSDLDSPVDLASRGLQNFMYGGMIGSDAYRQEVRNAIRSCTLADIKNAIEGVMLPKLKDLRAVRVCVIGEEGGADEIKNDLNFNWKIQK